GDNNGNYSIDLPKGSYQLYAECKGYGKGELVDVQAAGSVDLKTGPQKQKLELQLKVPNCTAGRLLFPRENRQ
ncbi:carboxypeptidase-like regulatory domain-containing protein, partial [Pseudomonas aeruginosa]|nr:carboxypeptidase-like regulatory domain-containing protein [Pseudomonas aeruginosa]